MTQLIIKKIFDNNRSKKSARELVGQFMTNEKKGTFMDQDAIREKLNTFFVSIFTAEDGVEIFKPDAVLVLCRYKALDQLEVNTKVLH